MYLWLHLSFLAMIQSSKFKLRQILDSQNYDVIKMNARDSDGLTPFLIACVNGPTYVVEFLNFVFQYGFLNSNSNSILNVE